MKIVFFGNTKYSVIDEEALHKKFDLSLVVTIPARPHGRKRELKPTPVKKFATENNIPAIETDKLDEKAKTRILRESPDFLVVADYGLILPNQVLKLPKYAAICVHHSLLPKYRGPSPAPTVILNGEKTSGVTIIKMTWDVDAGDILAQKAYELKMNETCDSLLTELNKLGGQLAIEVIKNFRSIKAQKQDDLKATYTHRFTKSDGQIDLNDPPPPQTFDRMIRAFYPWPTVWSEVKVKSGKFRIKFLPNPNYPTTKPSNHLTKYLIQPEGKRPMTIAEFKNGYPLLSQKLAKIFKNL